APQMGALKRLATAVLQPVWGNDAGQLYIGLPRQLLELALVGAYHAGFGDHDDLHAAAWAYTFMVCIATAPQENRAARARAARPTAARRAGSCNSSSIAVPIASVLVGSTSSAASPATSGSAERSEVITAAPQAIASSTGIPKPS